MVSDEHNNDTSDTDDGFEKFDPHNLKAYNKLSTQTPASQTAMLESENGAIIQEWEWNITSVNVYTTQGYPVFSANYTSNLSEFDSSIVLQFYTTVQTFAENNLKTSLIDFKVGEERVFFKVDNNRGHIYLITVKLGDRVNSGLNSAINILISSLITDLSTLLYFYESEGDIEENFSLYNGMTEIISDINTQKLAEKDTARVDELSISYTLITDNTGIPIFSKAYGDGVFSDEDPILITMFLHALNVFFNTNFADELREINFGNSRLYIKNFENYFYAILIEFDKYVNLTEESMIHQLSFGLIDQMVGLVEQVGIDLIEDMSNDSLQLMIDNLIFKGMFNLNETLS